MIRLDASSYIVAAIGILVPVVYAVFVICHLSDETRKRVQQNGGALDGRSTNRPSQRVH